MHANGRTGCRFAIVVASARSYECAIASDATLRVDTPVAHDCASFATRRCCVRRGDRFRNTRFSPVKTRFSARRVRIFSCDDREKIPICAGVGFSTMRRAGAHVGDRWIDYAACADVGADLCDAHRRSGRCRRMRGQLPIARDSSPRAGAPSAKRRRAEPARPIEKDVADVARRLRARDRRCATSIEPAVGRCVSSERADRSEFETAGPACVIRQSAHSPERASFDASPAHVRPGDAHPPSERGSAGRRCAGRRDKTASAAPMPRRHSMPSFSSR